MIIDYNREAAERFGHDAYICILCGSDPQKLEGHIDDAAHMARLAFHFASLVVPRLERS